MYQVLTLAHGPDAEFCVEAEYGWLTDGLDHAAAAFWLPGTDKVSVERVRAPDWMVWAEHNRSLAENCPPVATVARWCLGTAEAVQAAERLTVLLAAAPIPEARPVHIKGLIYTSNLQYERWDQHKGYVARRSLKQLKRAAHRADRRAWKSVTLAE